MLSRNGTQGLETLLHALRFTSGPAPSRPCAAGRSGHSAHWCRPRRVWGLGPVAPAEYLAVVALAGRSMCGVAPLLRLRPKVALGVEAMQAVRHVVLQPQRRHRALAEVRRIQHLRSTGLGV